MRRGERSLEAHLSSFWPKEGEEKGIFGSIPTFLLGQAKESDCGGRRGWDQRLTFVSEEEKKGEKKKEKEIS